MSHQPDYEWAKGRVSLAAASDWTPDEMRLVADLAFALAEQGCNREALTIFEGLAALAPATAYFQAALGALYLRTGDAPRAIEHLNAALKSDARDLTALLNRAEAYLKLEAFTEAEKDLRAALALAQAEEPTGVDLKSAIRARALLRTLPARRPHDALDA